MSFNSDFFHEFAKRKYKRGLDLSNKIIELCEKEHFDELEQYIASLHFHQYCRAVVKTMTGGKGEISQEIGDVLIDRVEQGFKKFTDEKVEELRQKIKEDKEY